MAICINFICLRLYGLYVYNLGGDCHFCFQLLINLLTFTSFSISPDKPQSRLGVTLTLLLTAVAFKFVVASNLPTISYLTYLVREPPLHLDMIVYHKYQCTTNIFKHCKQFIYLNLVPTTFQNNRIFQKVPFNCSCSQNCIYKLTHITLPPQDIYVLGSMIFLCLQAAQNAVVSLSVSSVEAGLDYANKVDFYYMIVMGCILFLFHVLFFIMLGIKVILLHIDNNWYSNSQYHLTRLKYQRDIYPLIIMSLSIYSLSSTW